MANLYPASLNTTNGRQWGYINDQGNFVFSPQFDFANDFQDNDLAIVATMSGTGIINREGIYVVAPEYSSIFPFTEGRAIVMEETGGSQVIDEEGNVLTQKPYDFISPYVGERAVFLETSNSTSVYGYLNRDVVPVIPAQYRYAFDFTDNGLALVQKEDNLYALIDKEGNDIQTFPYAQMNGLGNGLLPFKETFSDPFGYVDVRGQVVLEPRYQMALPFEGGRAIVNMSNSVQNKYGLIDRKGSFIIPAVYNDIRLLGEDRAAVGIAIDPTGPFLGSYYGIANSQTGEMLTDFFYNTVNDYQEGYSSVTQGIRTFFITTNGILAPNLPNIDGIGTLTLERELVKAFVDQRLTYYDRNGKLVWSENTQIPLTNSIYIQQVKYRPNKDYLVYYPQLRGMTDAVAQTRVNQVLREKSEVKPIPTGVQFDYSYTGDFSVKFFKKDLLVLELVGYNYPFGAAHGMPTKINVPINILTGEIYTLEDLFKPGSDYITILSEIVGKEIEDSEDGYYFPNAYEEIREDQPFYVTENALVLYFTPYEIAPYAAGFPSFTIPFEDIMDVIDTKGSFWKAFHL